MLCADQTITPNPENTGLGSMASRYPDSVPRWSDSTRYRVRCEVPTQAELPVTSEIFSRRNTWRVFVLFLRTPILRDINKTGALFPDNLKDLQRFLRRDDPRQRDVFKQICKWNTVSRNLVPLIEYYQSDRNLVINAGKSPYHGGSCRLSWDCYYIFVLFLLCAVKILVFLTMPIDPSSDGVAQQIEYLWDLKSALTRPVTIAVTVCLLEDPLDHLEW
ncbi:hypothetical protein B296_00027642 [Ensete ventricosum]|uniref:Timeless N-terminal domain-containing protein n=1 Tax=Ensete ventricosum TaxID=4639 RepID=A0A426YGE9_ENSVE|nr:hypothetical protein B296_00027642 [Ensete ventricosum]